jgi:hypothetical protein
MAIVPHLTTWMEIRTPSGNFDSLAEKFARNPSRWAAGIGLNDASNSFVQNPAPSLP